MYTKYTDTQIIDGKIVRRSTTWPNYGATSCGMIYRWDRKNKMSLTLTKKGYLYVRLCHNNVAECRFAHVLIDQCWVENPNNYQYVNHIDGDKTNCASTNLEWVTSSQNQRHAIDNKLRGIGEDQYNAQLTDEQVKEVCKLLVDGWRVKDLSVKFSVSADIIQKIKSGDSYPHIRRLYEIPVKYKTQFSESTIRWVCERIKEGLADATIAELSTNKNLSVYQVKRIRDKIIYSTISGEYF